METDESEEVSQLIDFVADLRIKKKHLLTYMPTVMNTELLMNKSINFDVTIIERCDTGEYISN